MKDSHGILDSILGAFVPIHPDGYKFVAGAALVTLILFAVAPPLGWLAALATAYCAYFFRDPERVTPQRQDLVVSAGLLLVTPQFELASTQTTGLLWAVLSGLLFALLSVANRASVKGIHPFQAALWQNLTIALCLLPLAWHLLPAVRPLDWLWLGLLGVFCTAIAHSLFVASLSVLKARSAALVFALEPVYGIAVAWWLFDEQPTLRMAAGGALILLAIALSARQKH